MVPQNGVDEPRNVVGDLASSSKLNRVKRAAVWAVLPVSCSSPDGPAVDASRLKAGLDSVFAPAGGSPGWVNQDLGRRLAYAQDHTTVDLAPPANGTSYDGNEDLTVRVRHDFYMAVPYAARIFSKLTREGRELDFGRGQFAMAMQAQCTLTNEGAQDYVDVEPFPRDRHR